jgi:NAD(P)-dependent dehydrogenase (short-subunit alcohol dehydrogenase family)
VTGGGSGIGRAAARKMAEEGATAVVIAGRREAEIESARILYPHLSGLIKITNEIRAVLCVFPIHEYPLLSALIV